jgi:hypothetical protein
MSRTNGSNKHAKRSKQSSLYFIPCTVEPGMFNGEWLVHLNVVDPKNSNNMISVKLFADERDIMNIQGSPDRHNPVNALLRVAVVKRTGKFVEVVFPQPAQPVGESAFFDESLLQEANT